jgi:WD40 repeat protein
MLLLLLLPFVPLSILLFQKRQPEARFRFQAALDDGVKGAAYATSIAYSPDGQTLACAFAIEKGRKVVAGQLQLWTPTEIRFYNSQSGVRRKTIHLASGTVSNLTFSPDSGTLRADCQDGFTRWWDVTSGQVLRQVRQGKLWLLASSPDGRWQIAQRVPKPKSPPYNYVILLLDNKSGKVVHSFIIGERPISAAAFSADSRQFVFWATLTKL